MDNGFSRVVQAGLRSFFMTLFLAIVLAPLWALLLIPRVGLALAPIVCRSGEMSYETTQTLGRDGLNTQTTFFCDDGAGPDTIPYSRLFLTPLVLHLALFFLLLWPLLCALYFWRSRPDLPKMGRPWPEQAAGPSPQTFTTTSSTFVIDGQQYNSPAEMPPVVRRQFDEAMSALPDEDGDGIPDILQGNFSSLDLDMAAAGQSVEQRLEALQSLYAKQLISEAEYQAKRREILRQL